MVGNGEVCDPVMIAVAAIGAEEKKIIDSLDGIRTEAKGNVRIIAVCDPCGFSGSIEEFQRNTPMTCPGCGMKCEPMAASVTRA